jgi:hypothetical protein
MSTRAGGPFLLPSGKTGSFILNIKDASLPSDDTSSVSVAIIQPHTRAVTGPEAKVVVGSADSTRHGTTTNIVDRRWELGHAVMPV